MHRGALPKPSHAGVQRRRGSGGGSDLSDTRHVLSFRDCHHFDNGVGSLLHLHFSPRMNSSLRYDIGQILLEHLHHLLITMVQPILHVHPYIHKILLIHPIFNFTTAVDPIFHSPDQDFITPPCAPKSDHGMTWIFYVCCYILRLAYLLSIFYFGLCIGMVIINSMES